MERTAVQIETGRSQGSRSSSSGVLQRQCACGTHTMGGGQCAECQKKKMSVGGMPLQAKLAISEPGDVYEQEADRVAEQVMRMSLADESKRQKSGMTQPLVQRRASSGAIGVAETSPSVHKVLNSPGQPLDTTTRAFFEPRFGHDLSEVRVHSNTAAEQSARDVNAHAYTVGHNIVFGAGQFVPGTHDGRRLIAHELTHIVQQLGTQEFDVHRHAHFINPMSTILIQRFGSREHRSLGDTATGRMLVNVGGESSSSRFELTHGDVIALSGDYFLPDELMRLGAIPGNQGQNVGTRDEIIWALKLIDASDTRFSIGGIWHGFVFSDRVKAAVEARYQSLAAQNTSHFYAPSGRTSTGQPIRSSAATDVGAFGAYRRFHERALVLAYTAGGATGGTISRAMAMEAAAQHFLTDSFSAGHLRTPVALIRSYWGGRYPLFWYNLLHKMALDTVIRMNAIDSNVATTLGTVQDMYENIVAQVNAIATSLPQITLGDLLSLLFHDFDNVMGVVVRGGVVFGDSHLDDSNPSNITRAIAQDAIIAGNQDVNEAFTLGGSMPGLTEAAVFENVRTSTRAPANRYNAEMRIPDLDPSNPVQNWRASDFETLWTQHMVGTSGPTVGDQIRAAMLPGGEIRSQLNNLQSSFPAVEHVVKRGVPLGDLHPRRAYLEGFVQPLASDPRAGILSVIHWAPNYGLRDVDRDDISLATGNELSATGRLSGMTTEARAAYIRELIGGAVAGDEEALVIEIFSTAVASERPNIYRLVEGHNWNGNWVEGVFVEDDDIWNALNHSRLRQLRTLINEGVPSVPAP